MDRGMQNSETPETRFANNRMIETIQRDCHETSALTGINSISPSILRAIKSVPRHLFVPEDLKESAYLDIPLPIGWNQTISQPFVVALMTQLAEIESGSRVLEIGTGSGYQAAVIARLADQVFSIERIEVLARRAIAALASFGMTNVRVKVGDGQYGWAENGPYDAILVTAAVDELSTELMNQLSESGRLVVPLRSRFDGEMLTVITKEKDGSIQHLDVLRVNFVPLVTGIQRGSFQSTQSNLTGGGKGRSQW